MAGLLSRRPASRSPLLVSVFVALALLIAMAPARALGTEQRDYRHLVVLGDPHIPGKYLGGKEAVLKTVNSWDDVDGVVVVGDICETTGTEAEHAAARAFFARLTKPVSLINGNHDYIYEDGTTGRGQRIKGQPGARAAKLERFRQTFGLDRVYYSRPLATYFLVFLAVDAESSNNLAEMSNRQVEWLKTELKANRDRPTVIFFHGPLKGTLLNYNQNANTDPFVAQPHGELRSILLENPQVFLWVSGHMHTPATNESFRAPINVFEKQVTNIHNADMNRERIWTTSLLLYPDRVVVKTYDHKTGAWMEGLERVVPAPRTR